MDSKTLEAPMLADRHVTTYSAIIGSVISKMRTEANLRQEGLAHKSGVPQSTISRIERGDTHITVDQLRKIAPAIRSQPSQIIKQAEEAELLLKQNGAEITESVSEEMKNEKISIISGLALVTIIGFLITRRQS